MDPQIVEQILNVVYFLVGLAVGLFGLWQNQKYFLAQQQDKFEQIHAELREIRERFTTIAEITSERASAREDRLFSLAMQQAVVDSATEEAAAGIRAVVLEELERAGIPDAVQRTAELEEKVGKIVAESSERVVEVRQDADMYQRLLFLPTTHLEALKALGEEPFTVDKLALQTVDLFRYLSQGSLREIIGIWKEAGIVERSERGVYRVTSRAQHLLAEMDASEGSAAG